MPETTAAPPDTPHGGACPYDPTALAGQPIGMLHCPYCGLMVVGGMAHPAVRRYAPGAASAGFPIRMDVTDNPDSWTEDDEFDYDFGPDGPEPVPSPSDQEDDDVGF